MKQTFPIALSLLLWTCGPTQPAEQVSIPPGVSIVSITTSSLDYNLQPVNDVAHFPAFLESFAIHNTFKGLSPGVHYYNVVVANSDGVATCQDSPAKFESLNGAYEGTSTINASACLTEPGEYTLRVYLDMQLVMRKQVLRLSPEQTKSGSFDPYWNKGKFVEILPAAESLAGAEWKVKTLATSSGNLSHVYVTTHQGFNRIFYLERNPNNDIFSLMEYQEYGPEKLLEFTNIDGMPGNFRYWAESGKLYFFNHAVQGSYNLNSGELVEDDQLSFINPKESGFQAPSRERWLTLDAMVDGKRSLVSSDQYCKDPQIIWASWDETSSRLYYWIGCGQGSDYGFFTRDLNTGKGQRLLEDFQGVRYPFYFQNNGVDLVAFIEQEEGDEAKLKIATQANYSPEYGFGPNFRWGRVFELPVTTVDKNGAYLSVDFYKPPREYLSYSFSDGYANMMFGEITRIGRITDGEWKGLELYRMRDSGDTQGEKSMGANPTIEYTFLIRNHSELIAINAGDAIDAMRFRDPDGKRQKSELFSGATSVTYFKNQFITRLLSPTLLDIPGSDVKLKRYGIVKELDNPTFRTLFNHSKEGAILVKQTDNGSFWRINGDQTYTLYGYQYNFDGIIVNGSQHELTTYAPFTNLDCLGEPLDMAHILTPDPSRLVEIGVTSNNVPIFGFSSAQDEVLMKEYEALKESYTNSGQDFVNLNDFIKTIPLFLWKDPFGRYVRFILREYLAPSNCEPIVYLYPEKTTDVTVRLGENVKVIASNPILRSAWQLTASSDGRLRDKTTSMYYSYIFWEGISGHLPPLQKGSVVDTTYLRSYFESTLYSLGLNEKEISDFQEAWLKEFTDAQFYFIGFYDRHIIDGYAPMKVTPEPTTVIRILMDYRPLPMWADVEPPTLGRRPERKGFTVVEWAGLKRALTIQP